MSWSFLACAVLLAAQPFESQTDATREVDELEGAEAAPQEITTFGERARATDPTAASSTIERDFFASRQLSLAEALRREAGVTIQRYGGTGSLATVSLRGSTSQQVAVLLDGVVLNRAASGVVDLATLPLSQIARVEVYRGVVPVTFGTSAPGGAINVVPLAARDARVDATFGAGSFATVQGSVFASAPLGEAVTLGLGGGLTTTRGDFLFRNDNGTRFDENDDFDVRRANNDYVGGDTLLTLRAGAWKGARVELTHAGFMRAQGVAGAGFSPALATRLAEQRFVNALRLRQRLAVGHELVAGGFYTLTETNYRDPAGELGIGTDDVYQRGHVPGANVAYTGELVADAHVNLTLRVFGEARHELYDVGEETAAGARSTRTYVTLASDAPLDVGLLRTVFVPQVRVEYLTDQRERDASLLGSPRESFAVERAAVTWRFGARATPVDGLALLANVGTSFRQPEFVELFGNNGLILGNSALLPETAFNLDVGAAYAETFSQLVAAKVSATFFRNSVEDLILFVANSQATQVAQNLSAATLFGVETQAAIDVLGYVRARFDHTYLNTTSESEVPSLSEKTLALRPKSRWFALIEPYTRRVPHVSELAVFGEADWSAGNFLDSANLIALPSRLFFNAGVRATFFDDALKVTIEARNLADSYQYDIVGYPLPGRSFQFSLAYASKVFL